MPPLRTRRLTSRRSLLTCRADWLAASAASTSGRAYPRPNTRSIWLRARRHRATKRPPASVCDRDWRPEGRESCGPCPDRRVPAFEGPAVSGPLDRCRCWSRSDLADRAAQAAPHLSGLVASAESEGKAERERETEDDPREEELDEGRSDADLRRRGDDAEAERSRVCERAHCFCVGHRDPADDAARQRIEPREGR